MAISLQSLTPATAPLARDLLQRCWSEGGSLDFDEGVFNWRYLARPCGETLLALDRARCVAILSSFLRPYLQSGRRVTVRETFDWFCLPEYRRLALGIKLMQRMMAAPEPIIVIGGTKATEALLPRLKWQRLLPEVLNYLLPVSARVAAAVALRRVRPGAEILARYIPANLKFRRPRRVSPPEGSAQVCRSSSAELPEPPAADGYVLAGLLDPATLEWLARAPSQIGELITLYFVTDRELVGVSASRLQHRPEGYVAKILHLQSQTVSAEIIDWMVSETVHHLVELGAGIVACRSSCPVIGRALRRVGFFSIRPQPVFWWSRDAGALAGGMHLTLMRADDESVF
jgi:hypothetical protein